MPTLTTQDKKTLQHLISETASFHETMLLQFLNEQRGDLTNDWSYDTLWVNHYTGCLDKEKSNTTQATFPGREMDLMKQFLSRHHRMIEALKSFRARLCPNIKTKTELLGLNDLLGEVKKSDRFRDAQQSGRKLPTPFSHIYKVGNQLFPIRKPLSDMELESTAKDVVNRQRLRLERWLQQGQTIQELIDLATKIKEKHDRFLLRRVTKKLSRAERVQIAEQFEKELKLEATEDLLELKKRLGQFKSNPL